MPFGEGKEVIGAMFGDNEESKEWSDFFKYKTLYDSLLDLDIKIKFSLEQAIIKSQENNKIEAYYYIENAIFRIITAWDNLAQVYNIYSGLNKAIDDVYYADIFKQKRGLSPNDDILLRFRQDICKYINEENDTDKTDEHGHWLGNNRYIRTELRNQMSHRNSISKVSMSDYSMYLPDAPIFILRRLVGDYGKLYILYNQMLEMVKKRYK